VAAASSGLKKKNTTLRAVGIGWRKYVTHLDLLRAIILSFERHAAWKMVNLTGLETVRDTSQNPRNLCPLVAPMTTHLRACLQALAPPAPES
jgi:hypothetical protein